MKTLKKGLFLFVLSMVYVGVGWCGDNRGPGAGYVTPVFSPAPEGVRVTFSTTIPAATMVTVLGTHTATNFVVPSGILMSTGTSVASGGLATSTVTTYGGRIYAAFQITSATQPVRVDIGTITFTSSPYYEQKDWVILDDPIAVQEPILVYSSAPASIFGWFWTGKRR